MKNKSLIKILLLLGAIGLVVGAYGLFEALVDGTKSTALTSPVPWGLGVVTYLYFLGLSGGGFLIALLVTVGKQKKFEVFSGIAAWSVLVTEVCAGIAILSDLGHWERAYLFLLSPNIQAPMAWMFVFFTALLLIYCAKVLALWKGDSGRAHSLTLWSIPVALFFYATNGYIFGMISAQPMWGGAFIPVWFVLAALLSGGALIGVLAWMHSFPEDLMQSYGRVLFGLLVVFAAFEAMYLLAAAQSGDAEVTQALSHLLFGGGAFVFWGLHVGLGMVVPFVLMFRPGSANRTGFGALLIALAFIFARWSFVIPVQSVEPIEGLAGAFHNARLAYSYTPSFGEWLVTLFVASLCLVTLLIGPRLFPVLFNKHGEHHA